MFRVVTSITLASTLALAIAIPPVAAASKEQSRPHPRRAEHYEHAKSPQYRQDFRRRESPASLRPQIGPSWTGSNQCWTDLGYGRYENCDGPL
jgi:hypothetical protein